ncbi:MAG: hypothetical protein ACXVHV_08110, partial [Methanobacterium sp.]
QIWNRSYNARVINLVIEVYVKGNFLASYNIYQEITPLYAYDQNNQGSGGDTGTSNPTSAPDIASILAPSTDLQNSGNTVTLAINNILNLLNSNIPGMETITTIVNAFTTTIQSLIQELSSSSPVVAQVEQYFSVISDLGDYLYNIFNI